nr:isocitrate/isopropylmalate dehydrogenase family protein [Actinopolymorpha alba]
MNDVRTTRPATARTYRIALIPGDGIGPELVESAREVLAGAVRGTTVELTFGYEDGGAQTYRRTGTNLAEETLTALRDTYDAILKGPVGLPDVRRPDGTEAGVLGGVLRNGLDTYANVRPITLLPGVRTPTTYRDGDIDYVIVRENTEGLYLSRGLGIGNQHAMCDQLFMTRPGVERVVRYAFGLAEVRGGAPADGQRRVTCVDKSNVLRSFAFFREIFVEVAEEFPNIEPDFRYADAAAHDLVMDPSHFDVLVTENFLGDILSDLGAATVGGLGMCPAANIGDRHAYFEPIHGSAPTIAGRNLANPTSQILAGALMLDHLGLAKVADQIRSAVRSAFADGAIELTAAGQPRHGTASVTAAIIDRLSQGQSG